MTVRPLWQYLLFGLLNCTIFLGLMLCIRNVYLLSVFGEEETSRLVSGYHYICLLLTLVFIWHLNKENSQLNDRNTKFLINIIENITRNIAIVSKTGEVLFINIKTEKFLTKYCNGVIPDNFAKLIAEYDKSRFFSGISQSYKTPQNVQMQLHMSFNNVVEKLKPNTFIESELGKELDNELYEMEFSQNRWEGKPCVMIFFSLVKATEDRGSTVQLQSQSILHQINDLVLESCYKYKRFNSIDICKGIRRVIQIDVNDNAEVSKIGTEEGTGFNDKNSLEVVDHNKQFYRISLDVNFRNIDLVDIRPQAKHKNNLKISNKRKPKSESKSHNHAPDQRSSRKNFFSKEKALEKVSSHATTTMVALPKQNEGSQSARTKQLEKPAPKERMFMTHNKFYIKPVMSEIKEEENKSEISDSYKNREIASSEQANLSEAVKNMISSTSGVEGSTLNKNSPLFYDFEMLKTIVILVSNFLGLKASFVIDHDPLSLVNRRDEEFNKSNSLSKESSQVPKIRVILESRINDIALKNIKCLDDDYQQLDSAMKNKTMKSPAKGIKDFFQDQSGTRMYNKTSDEKSLKLKATESSRSGCLNHEDSESETEGIVSIDNENVRDRNVALRREFNFITKEARDSIQGSSRKDYSSKESSFHTEEKKRDPKSRQSKLDFVKKIEVEEPTGTQDSI